MKSVTYEYPSIYQMFDKSHKVDTFGLKNYTIPKSYLNTDYI